MIGDRTRVGESTWVSLVMAAVAILAVDWLGGTKPVRAVAERVLVPIERVAYGVVEAGREPWRVVSFYRTGRARLVDLEARLAESSVDLVELERLRGENEQLRSQLGAPVPSQWRLLPAEVLGSSESEMIIGVGERAGVEKGMAVVVGEVLAGVVEEVSQETSRVVRPSGQGSKLAVVVSGGGVDGVLVGNGAGARLTQVLPGAEIATGGVVVTSGSDGLPARLSVGRIVEVTGEASDLSKEARVRLMVEERSLETVFVVLEGRG